MPPELMPSAPPCPAPPPAGSACRPLSLGGGARAALPHHVCGEDGGGLARACSGWRGGLGGEQGSAATTADPSGACPAGCTWQDPLHLACYPPPRPPQASNAGGWAGDWVINGRRRSVAAGRKLVNTLGFWAATGMVWRVPGLGCLSRAQGGQPSPPLPPSHPTPPHTHHPLTHPPPPTHPPTHPHSGPPRRAAAHALCRLGARRGAGRHGGAGSGGLRARRIQRQPHGRRAPLRGHGHVSGRLGGPAGREAGGGAALAVLLPQRPPHRLGGAARSVGWTHASPSPSPSPSPSHFPLCAGASATRRAHCRASWEWRRLDTCCRRAVLGGAGGAHGVSARLPQTCPLGRRRGGGAEYPCGLPSRPLAP